MFKGKRFSKIAAMMLAMMMALIAAAPALAQDEAAEMTYYGKTEVSAEGQVYPYFRDFGGESYLEGEAAVYFIDGGDIPYMAMSEFMEMFTEFLEKGGGMSGMTYEITKMDDHEYRIRQTERNISMWIDTEGNRIIFDDYNAFSRPAAIKGSAGILELTDPKKIDLAAMIADLKTMPDEEKQSYIEAQVVDTHEEESLIVTVADTIDRTGGMIELNLSEYLIDLVEQDGECFVPLQTLTDLLLNRYAYALYFNGIGLYLMHGESRLMDQLYQAEPQEMSQEFALFNYNELRFMLDCCYGLKPEHNIEDFGTMLGLNTDLAAKLTSTDPNEFDDGVAQLVFTYFDDGHSSFNRASWRSTQDPNFLTYLGLAYRTSSKIGDKYTQARAAAYPDGVPMYEEVGDTAFITFDSFVAGDYSEYYHMEELDPSRFIIPPEGDEDSEEGEESGESAYETDTVKLLYYAYQQITREGSPIRNVVVDLSNNGGGMADAAVYTIAWMIGQANIAIRDTFTGAETIMRMSADLLFDESYDSTHQSLADLGYNLYCLTSISSFSCGNLVPAACKMSEQVTLMGKTSGGGSCVVLPCTSASGTIFQISGSLQISTIRNGSFYNVDQGIEPDVVLTRPESYYDREGLVEMIHNLK